MKLQKKLIQYNDLVFDGADMLSNASSSTTFKVNSTSYAYQSGALVTTKSGTSLTEPIEISFVLRLDVRKLRCDMVNKYKEYIKLRLVKNGVLWAVEGDRILYAYAVIESIDETLNSSDKYFIELQIDLTLYEGVWHIADEKKIFIKPFDICNFLECEDYIQVDTCENTGCCEACIRKKIQTPLCYQCSCVNGCLTEEDTLCANKDDILPDFWKKCGGNYKIFYDCEAAERVYGSEAMLGQRICKEDSANAIISGRFYSDTLLDTSNITITVTGEFHNPTFTINRRRMQVIGDFNGTLIVTGNYLVYYDPGSNDCPYLLDPDLVDFRGEYKFIVTHGWNSISVDTGVCCSGACAFIKIDSITI